MNDVYIAWLLLLCVFNIVIAQYPSPNWQNVALNKPCNMSSDYTGGNPSNDCSKAINGNTGTTFVDGNCIHTAPGDLTPTWTVDLGDSYTVRGIRIYARDVGGFQGFKRMGNVQVTVDNTDVYRFPADTSANTWNTTNIQQNTAGSSLPNTGRYVTLSGNTFNAGDVDVFLNICEVEAWVCSPGYYGQKCAQCKSECAGLPCDDINSPNTCPNPCDSNPCQHGGTCQRGTVNNAGTYPCQCAGTGYQGPTCQQDIDECAGTSTPCHNGGTCTNTPAGSYTCTCTGGYTGTNCTIDINECDGNSYPNPCHNGGTCANTRGSYTCICAVGYTGKQCNVDIDECRTLNPYPCQNGGTCTNTPGSYNCTCAGGYTGKQCDDDIDECPLITCDHGGTCMNTPGSYNCVCSIGYTGKNCETDINYCNPNPCLHGQCTDLETSYTCDCEPGYTGFTCSTDIDDCVSGPCINGTCTDRINGFACTCYAGYEGNTCEKVTDASPEAVSAGVVAGSVVGGMVLGAVILGVVGFFILRRRSKGAQNSPTRRHRDGSKVTRGSNSRTSSTAADYEDVGEHTGPRQQEEPAVEYYSSANPDQVHLSPTKGKNRVTKRASPAIGALDEGATANSPYYNTALDGSDEGFPSQTAATSSSPSATAAAAESNYEEFGARGIYDRPEMYENRMEHHVYTGLKKK